MLMLTLGPLAAIVTTMLLWIALVYVVMASGVRRGELVWTGRYPRRLPPELRRRSVAYALGLVASAWVIWELAGLIEVDLVPTRWGMSAGFVVSVFLGLAGLFSLVKGSQWERWLFAPMILASAAIAGFLAFG